MAATDTCAQITNRTGTIPPLLAFPHRRQQVRNMVGNCHFRIKKRVQQREPSHCLEEKIKAGQERDKIILQGKND